MTERVECEVEADSLEEAMAEVKELPGCQDWSPIPGDGGVDECEYDDFQHEPADEAAAA